MKGTLTMLSNPLIGVTATTGKAQHCPSPHNKATNLWLLEWISPEKYLTNTSYNKTNDNNNK